ncbi:MAG: hypothetical protein Kow0031_36950 [Anaerolineae bacterium]
MTVSTGSELENYILEEEYGRGDLTIVYRARRKTDGEQVAIKVVAPQFMFDDHFVRRFLDMGKQAARLEHPNIVRTYETRLEGDTLFIAREMADARPLADVLADEGPFGPQRTLAVAKQIAAALDYAHQKSIMHGDLSARRVYIGPNDHVLVADFGQMQSMAGTSLVKAGYAIGTPEVMAPERVHGQGPSRQSDLYSLGILCYQMLNGEPPFVGEPAAVLHAQAYEQPHPLHLVNPGVSLRLSEAIGRMLSKGLELRYTTGSEFTRALTVAAEGTSPIRLSSTATGSLEMDMPAETPLWQRPWVWAIIAVPLVLMLLVAGFLAVSVWMVFAPATRTEGTPAETGPTPVVVEVAPVQPPAESAAPPEMPSPTAVTGEAATAPPAPTPTPSPGPTATASPTPTLVPLPTPGPPVIEAGSPFTNLVLARGVTDEGQPDRTGASFAPGPQPIYLFFDYTGITAGAPYTHRWTWADTELSVNDESWPETFFESGTAWVFYSPGGGFQPGPYQVTLEIDGQVVATATFVVQPGGL